MLVSTPPAASSAGRVEAKRSAAVFGIIQRLDAEPIAREHDTAGFALGNREREHAVEALDAARPPGVIGLEDDFGVAVVKNR